MSAVKFSVMNAFIKRNIKSTDFASHLTGLSNFKTMNLENLGFSNIEDECLKVNFQKPKTKKNRSSRALHAWRKGEFKIFIWFLNFYLFSKGLTFSSLKQEDYEYFRSIFVLQTPQRLKYEAKCIFEASNQTKRWEIEETQLLAKLVKKVDDSAKIQWKGISFELYVCSEGKYFRNYAQCREMWKNHLNPEIVKKNWSVQEDLQLLEIVEEIGKQWSKISSKLPSKRTEHMVKNRYNSLIRQFQKKQPQESSAITRAIEYLRFTLKPSEEVSQECQVYNINQNQKNDSQDSSKKNISISLGKCSEESKELREELEIKNKTIDSLVDKIDEQRDEGSLWVPDLLHPMHASNFYSPQGIKPIMVDLTQRLGFFHVEQVDLLYGLQNEGGCLEDIEYSF